MQYAVVLSLVFDVIRRPRRKVSHLYVFLAASMRCNSCSEQMVLLVFSKNIVIEAEGNSLRPPSMLAAQARI